MGPHMHKIRQLRISSRVALAGPTFIILLSGCLPNSSFAADSTGHTAAPMSSTAPAPTSPSPNSSSGSSDTKSATPPAFKICSRLPVSAKVIWPSTLTATDDQAFLLSLNISGSFEGETGWSNLTNDFDGEGLSMGLLNQTLGTGSLEPLLIKMRDQHLAQLEATMHPGNASALLNMLSTWQGSNSQEAFTAMTVSESGALSPLDIESQSTMTSEGMMLESAKTSSKRNPMAVRWAVENLYSSSGGFLSAWARDLTALTTSPEYVSIQIAAAIKDHNIAIGQQKQIGCTELRCYLLMFDFAVQNGGLYAKDISDYKAYLSENPNLDETTHLKELVELRLRHVRAEFVDDVRSRKNALIDGQGDVHGENRNFENQYCFNRMTHYPLN